MYILFTDSKAGWYCREHTAWGTSEEYFLLASLVTSLHLNCFSVKGGWCTKQ